MQPIERRSNLSVEAFNEEYGRPGRPVIITDAISGWPAMTRWTMPFFASHCASDVVKLTRADGSKVTSTMASYMRYLKSHQDPKPMYLSSWLFAERHPELLADFEFPPYFAEDWLQDLPERVRPKMLWIFLGPKNAGATLHVDSGHTAAWNAQIAGRKAWKMFPPELAPLIYEGQADPFEPDLERFPRLAQADPWECVLEPGEIIFTPSRWWHCTLNLKDSIAVTANYVNATNYQHLLQWASQNGSWLQQNGMEDLPMEFLRVNADRVREATSAEVFPR